MTSFFRPALLAAAASLALAVGASAEQLSVGDTAPDFTLPGSDGNDTTLYEVLESQNAVLAFFPKAFTGG